MIAFDLWTPHLSSSEYYYVFFKRNVYTMTWVHTLCFAHHVSLFHRYMVARTLRTLHHTLSSLPPESSYRTQDWDVLKAYVLPKSRDGHCSFANCNLCPISPVSFSTGNDDQKSLADKIVSLRPSPVLPRLPLSLDATRENGRLCTIWSPVRHPPIYLFYVLNVFKVLAAPHGFARYFRTASH